MKKYLNPAIKILVSGLAIYFVFQKINWLEVWKVIQTAHPAYVLLGLVFFGLSKLIAAFRLYAFLKAHKVPLSHRTNLKLYLLGMFYNLFLPGGIGGDGYKVFWLNKQYGSEVKPTILSLLLDRFNGLSALAFLAMLSFLAVPLEFPYKLPMVLVGLVLMYPIYYLVIRQFFPTYQSVFLYTSFLSLLVQLSQMVCILFLLLALGIQ
ncbi:MAG: lysylphosphatidylglycerol synthase transmembrane domain-containing protein, partial [Bacteroidota bacterium]